MTGAIFWNYFLIVPVGILINLTYKLSKILLIFLGNDKNTYGVWMVTPAVERLMSINPKNDI